MFPNRRNFLALVGVLAAMSAAVRAQQPAAAPAAAAPPAPWLIALGAQSSYDSNLLQNNQRTVAGWEEQITGLLQWQQRTPTGSVQVRYAPAMDIVTAAPGLNSTNQTAGLTWALQPAPRWSLQGSADGSYWEQMPTAAEAPMPVLLATAPLPLLPRTRAAAGDAQLQLGYVLSSRSTLQLYGGYDVRRFPGAGAWSQTLQGEHGDTSGLRYTFRATPRTQWGADLGQQNFSIGHAAHLAAVSLLLRVQHALTPLTSVQLYGGPEYSQVHETDVLHLNAGGLPLTLTDRLYRVRTYPRVGASLHHDGEAWPWQVSIDRQISNGGGALPFPTSLLTASGSIGRRFSSVWRTQFGLSASQFAALDGGSALAGHVRFAAANMTLTRRLNRHTSLDFDYQYFLQRSSGLLPLAPGVNRSIAGVRVRWQWPPLPEGGF